MSFANESELKQLDRELSVFLLTNRTSPIPLRPWAEAYLGRYLTAPHSLMHRWLIARLSELQNERGRKYAILAPRGSAKTTWIGKVYPLYCAVYNLERYIIIISNTAAQAEKNLSAIRDELETSALLRRDYRAATGRGPIWRRECIETANGVYIEAMGMGSKLRGRTFGPSRPTLIIVDDVENDEGVESDSQREKAADWLMRAVIPAGTEQTNFFVLGTALHRDDLLQTLRKTPGWHSRTFQSILREPSRDDLWQQWKAIYTQLDNPHCQHDARGFYERHNLAMDAGAKLLWPDRESIYELMCLRATIGEAAFDAEKQGIPTQAGSAEWPEKCFDPSIWFDTWPETVSRVIALDPSKGESDVADYSAYVMLGLGADHLMYVEADLARRDVTRMIDDGLDLAVRFRPDALLVETNQFQALIKDELERKACERQIVVPLYGVNNQGNKRLRIRRLTPYLCRGMFRFKSSSPGTHLLVDQLRDFPNSRHDDGPDALEMAVRMLNELTGTGESQLIREIIRA